MSSALQKPMLVSLLLSTAACVGNFESGKEEPIARVYDTYLMPSEIKSVTAGAATPEDSAQIARHYVESWVKIQLLYHEAVAHAKIDLNEIERRTKEYKYQLITHAFLQQYISERLDTVVTEQQIRQYYQTNKANFELKQNIVKGILFKLSDNAPDKAKALGWLKSRYPDDGEQLRSYALNYTENPLISDTTWIPFSELVANTPFQEQIKNEVQFLATQHYAIASDGNYLYMLKILEYKIADQISPLEFVKDQIREIILNQRKMTLQRQLEISLLEKARKSGNYQLATMSQ